MKLDKYDIKLTNGCAKEQSRPILTNVCLRDGKLAAADGFMLVVRDADLGEGENPPETMLPTSILKTVKADSKRIANLEINDGCKLSYYRENLAPLDYEPVLSFKLGTDKAFPDFDQLFPKEQKKTAVTAVSVGLLKKLCSILPDDGILRLGISNPVGSGEYAQPIEFHCGKMDRPIYGLLMPMYVDWQDFKWTRAKEEKQSNTSKEGN